MKVDERVTGFSLNVKKDMKREMLKIAKEKGTTLADMTRASWARTIRAEQKKKGVDNAR